MRRSTFFIASLLALAPMGLAMAQRPAPAVAVAAQGMAYGSDPKQTLDFWTSARADAPLVIFVHGGGWRRGDKDNATGRAKISHFHDAGYAFASINYRLVPQATVEQEAQDVADALAYLIARADKLGFDKRRIVLMGHSAGAHLVALVGTDMRYFKKARLAPDSVRGIVALDGAAYDVARQKSEVGTFMGRLYDNAFGSDPQRQVALSPTLQAAKPNAPAFLILHVDRADGKEQSEALAAALRKAGTPAEVHAFEGKGLRGHAAINRDLGDPDYPATAVVDAWLKRIMG